MPPDGCANASLGTCRAREVYVVKGRYTAHNDRNAAPLRLGDFRKSFYRLTGLWAQARRCRLSYIDRKSTRLNSSHMSESRMPSSA